MEELLDLDFPLKLIALTFGFIILEISRDMLRNTPDICSQPRSGFTLLEQTPASSRLLLGHNFLLLVCRNGVGKSNFPRFPRTSFTCMCLRPKSIRIKADLVFVISHCQSYEGGRIFLFMVLAKAASSPFLKLEWF